MEPIYLSIQPVETGKRIKQLLSEQNYTISRLLHTSIENILVIDGDIPRLWVSLNQWFNDIFSLLPYNRVIRK